jgi:hypothetical protein
MTEEIDRMLADLIGIRNDDNLSAPATPNITLPPTVPATAMYPRLLVACDKVRAHTEYLSEEAKHLAIRVGDVIDVYVYVDDTTAVGFNRRSKAGGAFPIEMADIITPGPREDIDMLYCDFGPGDLEDQYDLECRLGDFIRVLDKGEHGDVYGFNQRTFDMGRLDVGIYFTWVKIDV